MKEINGIKTNTNQKLLDSREERKRKVTQFCKVRKNILYLNIQKSLEIVLKNWHTKNENRKKRASILHLHHARESSTHVLHALEQRSGREKYSNHGKFIGSSFIIFCFKEFEKYVLCKSISQSEVILIVYSEPVES